MKIQRMCIFPHSVEMFFFTLGGNVFFPHLVEMVQIFAKKSVCDHKRFKNYIVLTTASSRFICGILIITTLSDFFLCKEGISKHTKTTFQPEAESNMKQKMVLQLSVCIMWIYLEQRCSLFDLVLGFLALRTRVGSSRKQV